MRFFYSKKEHTCRYCKSIILYGEETVALTWNHFNSETGSTATIPLIFHTVCYPDWVVNSFNNRLMNWRENMAQPHPPKPKMGRPPGIKNPPGSLTGRPARFSPADRKLANRIRSLARYHQARGNLSRALQLEIQLVSMEVKSNGQDSQPDEAISKEVSGMPGSADVQLQK